MKITLECKASSFVPLSVSAGEGDEVKIEIVSSYELKKSGRVLVKNAEKSALYVIGDNTIDISSFCEKAGKVEIEVVNTVDGEIVRRWTVEPLLVKNIDGEFRPIPQITAMEAEIALLKSAIKEITKIIKGE